MIVELFIVDQIIKIHLVVIVFSSMAFSKFLLSLLLCQVMTAPRTAQDDRSKQDDPKIQNPFSSGAEQLRFLQGYLEHADPLEKNAFSFKREKAILHLFLLHDFDKSGELDGLELMQLLNGTLSQRMQEQPPPINIIRLVDEVLDKQDLNRDGLLSAPELLMAPVNVTEPITEEDQSTDTFHVAIPLPQAAQTEDNPQHLEIATIDKEKEVDHIQMTVVDGEAHDSNNTVIIDEPEDSDRKSFDEPEVGDIKELTEETMQENVELEEHEVLEAVVGDEM
ncbi:cell growth regulator with EF hand domain protein 1 isoform X1 [Pelobates fuscus]|uniref:cell growth regulator with EF hand domain protein 1 isoform X1 n=2 Tax=Pelobates fuscus TaxID=191477 RepID=UPI002FE46128